MLYVVLERIEGDLYNLHKVKDRFRFIDSDISVLRIVITIDLLCH